MAEKSVIEGELRVKDILREKGMRMYELAEKIGVAPESLTRALQRNPQYSTLKAIANALGVHIRDLFREEEVSVPIVRGMVELKGKILYIDSLEDIYRLVTEVEKAYEEAEMSLPSRT
ncbi:MAG: helix-turn-helix domain-containing protein [Alistipes sp.]|nr:helix-turn-helix domain-containing protein [Alistipes sp.]